MKTHRLTLSATLLLSAIAPGALSPRAHAAPEPARGADDFVDAMGVCTHWSYLDTPYGTAYPAVSQLLGESGIRHVRDGLHPRETDLWQRFGIRSTVIFEPPRDPKDSTQTLEPVVAQLAMIEGPNEVDIFEKNGKYGGEVFPQGARLYQDALYAAIKNNPLLQHLPVIAPSTARNDGNLKLAPLSSFDRLVMHSYAGGEMPSRSLHNETISNLKNAVRLLPPGATVPRIVVTESGYHTALGANLTLGGVQPGVTEEVQGKYLPRHFAEYWNAGIERTFIYEFLNEFKDEATNAEASFGIVRRDLTPKPAYQRLKTLTHLLSEAKWDAAQKQWQKPQFVPRALDFDLIGAPEDVHHALLQKSDGDFYLLLWREVSSFDTKTQQPIAVEPAKIVVSFGGKIRSAELFSLQTPVEARARRQQWQAPRTITLDVPDEIVIMRISPAATKARPLNAPQNVQAETGGQSVDLMWDEVAGATSYFVWRTGKYLGRSSKAKWHDEGAHLTPGLAYSYTIRAGDNAGNLSLESEIIAPTKAIFPDLQLTALGLDDGIKAGDKVILRATIANNGAAATLAGTTHGVAFFVDDKFVAWSDTYNKALEPGQNIEVIANAGPNGTATWTATAGKHILRALVDDVNRIDESDEKNNERTVEFTVGP